MVHEPTSNDLMATLEASCRRSFDEVMVPMKILDTFIELRFGETFVTKFESVI